MCKNEELIRKVNDLLEKTKEEADVFENERKELFELYNGDDEKECQRFADCFEKLIILNNRIDMHEDDKNILREYSRDLKSQSVRECDKNGNIFRISDKEGRVYEFITRKSAERFVNDNREKFDDNIHLEVREIKNVDMEIILSIIKKYY